MADTKISGLTAAASFLVSHEIPVNEAGTSKKVTGAQIMAALPQGRLGYAQVLATQGTFTALTDITGLAVTITPASASRRIKITCQIAASSSVVTDQVAAEILEGATVLQTGWVNMAIINVGYTINLQVIIVPTLAAHTYKISMQRQAGSGNITMQAGATFPAFILVEDVGT